MNNDLISREALKEEMNKKALDLANGGMIFIETINNVIDNAPTIESDYEWGYSEGVHDTERPQGTWKESMRGYQGKTVLSVTFKCSCCGRRIVWVPSPSCQTEEEFLSDYPFCHCGAEMQKGGAE